MFFKVNFRNCEVNRAVRAEGYGQSPRLSLILNDGGSFSFTFKFDAIFSLSFSPLGFFLPEMYITAFLPTSLSKRICSHPHPLQSRWP